MPKQKLSMRKIKEVICLKWDCQNIHRQIAESCSIAQSTVSDYLTQTKAASPFNSSELSTKPITPAAINTTNFVFITGRGNKAWIPVYVRIIEPERDCLSITADLP